MGSGLSNFKMGLNGTHDVGVPVFGHIGFWQEGTRWDIAEKMRKLRLCATEIHHGGLKTLFVPTSTKWLPTFAVNEAFNEPVSLSGTLELFLRRAIVTGDNAFQLMPSGDFVSRKHRSINALISSPTLLKAGRILFRRSSNRAKSARTFWL